MPNGASHAETPAALYSLPVAAPDFVLRAGELLKAAGTPLAAIELYERFIAGLQSHALSPLPRRAGGDGGHDHGAMTDPLLAFLPVRKNPERYSLA